MRQKSAEINNNMIILIKVFELNFVFTQRDRKKDTHTYTHTHTHTHTRTYIYIYAFIYSGWYFFLIHKYLWEHVTRQAKYILASFTAYMTNEHAAFSIDIALCTSIYIYIYIKTDRQTDRKTDNAMYVNIMYYIAWTTLCILIVGWIHTYIHMYIHTYMRPNCDR